ncbi:RDD family protein [Mycobacterium sp. M26]|uniref:RDD family protein n=1 Tax=Mycobacterium sp. M26 TaxID=1762962 RepID=UPI000A4F847F
MTVTDSDTTLDTAEVLDTVADEPAAPKAGWRARAGAFAIDVLVPLGVLATLMLVAWSAPLRGWLWWLTVSLAGLVFLAAAVNRWLLPSLRGATLGRSLLGIELVSRTGARVGPWRLLVRDIAHLLDTVPVFIGWLWPLWDSRGRTFADFLTRTEVRRIAGERPDRGRLAGAVLAGAAVIAVAAAGLNYLTVYRHDHAVDTARTQIAAQGPKIVENMLSYDAASIDADFARARDLVTDAYRPQLVAQQDAVRKAGPVDNDYWVTNSAVLTNTPDSAVMLLLMQGQRGAAPKQRLITATVRANFEKSADGHWRVSNISVLAKPNPAGQPEGR